MPSIDQDSLAAIQRELTSGERVLWAGRPGARLFHRHDAFQVPFSLMWGGFAIFWEMGALGFWGSQKPDTTPSMFMVLWGIPFVVIGQYLIWGRFVHAAWKKKRTYYAVTSKRVIAVQDGWTRKTASTYLDTLPSLTKEGHSGNCGTLRFSPPESLWSKRQVGEAWNGMEIEGVPVFFDINDVDAVYHLIAALRDKATAAGTTSL
jgi:hypothetical protein